MNYPTEAARSRFRIRLEIVASQCLVLYLVRVSASELSFPPTTSITNHEDLFPRHLILISVVAASG